MATATETPLWVQALPGITGILALLVSLGMGWITTWHGSRNLKAQNEQALQILRESHVNERQSWLRDHKFEAYSEALGLMQRTSIDAKTLEGAEHLVALGNSAIRIGLVGSQEAAAAIAAFLSVFQSETQKPLAERDFGALAKSAALFSLATSMDIQAVQSAEQEATIWDESAKHFDV